MGVKSPVREPPCSPWENTEILAEGNGGRGSTRGEDAGEQQRCADAQKRPRRRTGRGRWHHPPPPQGQARGERRRRCSGRARAALGSPPYSAPRPRGAARRGTGVLRRAASAAGIVAPWPRRADPPRAGGLAPRPAPPDGDPAGARHGAGGVDGDAWRRTGASTGAEPRSGPQASGMATGEGQHRRCQHGREGSRRVSGVGPSPLGAETLGPCRGPLSPSRQAARAHPGVPRGGATLWPGARGHGVDGGATRTRGRPRACTRALSSASRGDAGRGTGPRPPSHGSRRGAERAPTGATGGIGPPALEAWTRNVAGRLHSCGPSRRYAGASLPCPTGADGVYGWAAPVAAAPPPLRRGVLRADGPLATRRRQGYWRLAGNRIVHRALHQQCVWPPGVPTRWPQWSDRLYGASAP